MRFTAIKDLNTEEKKQEFRRLCRNNPEIALRALLEVIRHRDELNKGEYTYSIPVPETVKVEPVVSSSPQLEEHPPASTDFVRKGSKKKKGALANEVKKPRKKATTKKATKKKTTKKKKTSKN